MTENEFYEELLQLPDLRITGVERKGKQIILHAETKTKQAVCPHCQQPTQNVNQYTKRQVRDLDISGKEVWLHLRVKQFICPSCNRHFTEQFGWVEPNKSYTKRQSKWIFELCAKQPFTEAGALVNMCHKTVERLYFHEVRSRLNLPAHYAQVRRLGLDEFSHIKGQRNYCCVLTDLDRGILLDILPDRKKETLLNHFQSLGPEFCRQIELVSCDIWKPYIHVAKECFPNAQIVLDRFHVVKALNEVLDQFAKKLRRQFKEENSFKRLKWKLFKRPELSKTEDLQALQKAFIKSPELKEIYRLRNVFNTILDTAKDRLTCMQQLDHWMNQAAAVKDKYMNTFLRTLGRWKENIAAYTDTRLTNAATEGLNNLIRYFKRISFGLPNFEKMRLRVLATHV